MKKPLTREMVEETVGDFLPDADFSPTGQDSIEEVINDESSYESTQTISSMVDLPEASKETLLGQSTDEINIKSILKNDSPIEGLSKESEPIEQQVTATTMEEDEQDEIEDDQTIIIDENSGNFKLNSLIQGNEEDGVDEEKDKTESDIKIKMNEKTGEVRVSREFLGPENEDEKNESDPKLKLGTDDIDLKPKSLDELDLEEAAEKAQKPEEMELEEDGIDLEVESAEEPEQGEALAMEEEVEVTAEEKSETEDMLGLKDETKATSPAQITAEEVKEDEDVLDLKDETLTNSQVQTDPGQEAEQLNDEDVLDLKDETLTNSQVQTDPGQEAEQLNDEDVLDLKDETLTNSQVQTDPGQEAEQLNDEDVLDLKDETLTNSQVQTDPGQEAEQLNDEDVLDLKDETLTNSQVQTDPGQEAEQLNDEDVLDLKDETLTNSQVQTDPGQEADKLKDEDVLDLKDETLTNSQVQTDPGQEADQLKDEDVLDLKDEILTNSQVQTDPGQEAEQLNDENLNDSSEAGELEEGAELEVAGDSETIAVEKENVEELELGTQSEVPEGTKGTATATTKTKEVAGFQIDSQLSLAEDLRSVTGMLAEELEEQEGDGATATMGLERGPRLAALDESQASHYQGMIRQLREEREELLGEIRDLKMANKTIERDFLGVKAELEDTNIGMGIAKKRHTDEVEELKYQKNLAEEKNLFAQEKMKKLQKQFDHLEEKIRFDYNHVKERERELQSRLEIMEMDSESQLTSRDKKILELKKKIDQLEFNMENAVMREKKFQDDKSKVEDKMSRIMKNLRYSIELFEEEAIIESAHGENRKKA